MTSNEQTAEFPIPQHIQEVESSINDRIPADSNETAEEATFTDQDRYAEILASINNLQFIIDAIGKRSHADQNLIQRMQDRIEKLQADQVRALFGPVVTKLADLQADFFEAAERDYEMLGLARLRKEFTFLGERLDNALDLLGAVSVNAKSGQKFDSRIHTAAKQKPTDDPSLDLIIESVLRQGFIFQHESKPALYARVSVYKYDSALTLKKSNVSTLASPDSSNARDSNHTPTSPLPADATESFQLPFQSKEG